MHFGGQRFDALAQLVGQFGQAGILFHEVHQLRGLPGGEGLALHAGIGEVLAMGRIGFGMSFIPIRLAGLRQKDERGGIRGLETKGEVEEDERVLVKAPSCGDGQDVHDDPDGDDRCLPDKKNRGAKKAGERLGLQGEPVVAKCPGKVRVGQMKTKMVRIRRWTGVGGIGWFHNIFRTALGPASAIR